MALAKRKCRVCGEPYEACRSTKRNPDVFVWQEVACSLNCGSIYLEQIYASRNIQLAKAIAIVEMDEPAPAVITSDELDAPAVKKKNSRKSKAHDKSAETESKPADVLGASDESVDPVDNGSSEEININIE